MLLSLGLTLALESLVALAWSRIKKKPALSIPLTGLAANLLTQLALWAALGLLVRPYWAILLPAEIAIWLVEGLILAAPPCNHLRLAEALRLSLWMNLVSFGVGLMMPA